MSKKKGTPLDILGESHIPSELLGGTLGSTYLQEGMEDLQYDMGTLNLAAEGDPGDELEISLISEGAENMNLDDFLKEGSLSDLDWLDPSQEQDPDRLPYMSEAIPELEEAWSENQRYSGLGATPNLDLGRARYEASLNNPEVKNATDAKILLSVVSSVMRRSAQGKDIDTAIRGAMESVGEDMDRIATSPKAVKNEHGLAGNVFIRASAYPGYGQGKWKEELRKTSARYVIVSKADLSGAAWIKDGLCQITGKRAVVEVPWKQAYEFYRPRLEGTGRRVASAPKDYAAALRASFLSVPHKEALQTAFPTHLTPSERITAAEARQKLAEFAPLNFASDPTADRIARELPRVEARLQQMVAASMLTEDQRSTILASGGEPSDMLRTAGSLAVRSNVKKGEFSGQHNEARLAAESAAMSRSAAVYTRQGLEARALAAKEAEIAEGQKITETLDRVKKLVARGLRGEKLVGEIRRVLSSHDLRKNISAIRQVLVKTGALREVKVAEYQGAEFSPAPVTVSSVHAPVREFPGVKWARRMMSEGFAGKELSGMIQAKFTASALEEAEESMREARSLHEGAAGFLYVDAGAYATPTGVKGCEAGAAKHASNIIPALAAMPRCATCSLASAMEDGTKKCSLYRKTLLSSRETQSREVTRMKLANIKQANDPDFNKTASIFAPAYDPDEFGLEAPASEGIEFSDPEKLGEILFGSWDL